MKNKIFLVAALVSILAVAGIAFGVSGCASRVTAADLQPVSVNVNNQQGIWVNGTGKITVTPDIALVNLGVSAQAATVAEANAQAAAAMDKVIAALKANGVAEKDIQTRYFNIQQTSRWDEKTQDTVVTGYIVSNTVSVKIRKVADAGKIIDAVVAAGGDYTRVNGLSFTVDNPEQYYSEARELAMKEAKAKAQELAELSGVTLGKATYITESSSGGERPYPYPMYDKGAAGAVPETYITPGETDITVNVQVAYSIL